MNDRTLPASGKHDDLIASLQERAKELNCLYQVEEILNKPDLPLEEVFQSVVRSLGPGWQFPEICEAEIVYQDIVHRSREFQPGPWFLRTDIHVHGQVIGSVAVYYLEERPEEDVGPFLKEEERLIKTVAERLGHYILYQRLREVHQESAGGDGRPASNAAWRGPVHLLRDSDRNLYLRVARKMLNHLVRIGIAEAQELLPGSGVGDGGGASEDENVPGKKWKSDLAVLVTDRPFELAGEYMSDSEILARIQRWIQEDRARFLIEVLNNPRSSLLEIGNALRRFYQGMGEGSGLQPSTLLSIRVALTQRLLTEQLDFVKTAKEFVEPSDFRGLLDNMILPNDSHGKLGGKSAGLFLAHHVLMRSRETEPALGTVKVPRTWYIASDGILDFIGHNDLQDVIDQKFKEIDQVRQEYPNIVQLFKNSSFPSEIIKGLSVALDDFGNVPLIVRSSSLLEDRVGTAFSGKYKSLFVANQGTKAERLEALLDAIAEVYSSTFSPDPIEYRRERGLLEFNEEMGILIQEVVGKRVGRFYFPAFAGVAFSNNEFRWSPRIQREDGLIRLVPGLGTRAVDRLSDDYPILLVPGQPGLRANVALDEIMRYSPKKMDVIDLEANRFETVEIGGILRECGHQFPGFTLLFSVLRSGLLQRPVGIMVDTEEETLVPTFEGLVSTTPFLKQVRGMLAILQEQLRTPVDIEFAHDGTDLYLLQCRPQSFTDDALPSPIPKEVPSSDVVFSANRHVSNGWVPDITHIVYVDPLRYTELSSRNEMLAVGRAIGKLNKILPKRQFILMGPGRWGSRGDIKLGVSVTYADISNTAVLIEVARKQGNYLPDVSFGTHFFQDLVESHIRYLPLYPDDDGIAFNETFLRGAPNLLPRILPECRDLAEVIRVIDVPAVAEGRVLRVLLNADLDEALGLIVSPDLEAPTRPVEASGPLGAKVDYTRWRLKMTEQLARELDPERFGVAALYVFGSVKNNTAGPASDIDLLVHVRGTEAERRDLETWLEGWSLCLAEMNYLRTGYRSEGLLDVHIVTDEDIRNRSSFAAKIDAVTDAARPLPMGGQGEKRGG